MIRASIRAASHCVENTIADIDYHVGRDCLFLTNRFVLVDVHHAIPLAARRAVSPYEESDMTQSRWLSILSLSTTLLIPACMDATDEDVGPADDGTAVHLMPMHD